MSRRRRTITPTLALAAKRIAGMQSIGTDLDLGNGMTLETYIAAQTDTQKKLDAYNTKLADSDAAQNVFLLAETNLSDLNQRMLAAVKVKFGADSDEYEKAGGTRRSERKRFVRKPAEPATP